MTELSSSDRLGSFFGRLHPITRFLLVVCVLHLIATLAVVVAHLPSYGGQPMRSIIIAEDMRSVAYSLTYIGGAASVEFLFRIWDELKRTRTGD
jgi:amino acid transporter